MDTRIPCRLCYSCLSAQPILSRHILSGNLEIVAYFTTKTTDYNFINGFLSEIIRQLMGSTGEEVLFRAFLFYIVFEAIRSDRLAPVAKAVAACAILSPIFGLFHLSNEGATVFSTINLGLDAMMICLPFLITGRLGMSIGMHFSWNVMQGAIFGFANSGHIAKALIISSEMPETMLTGNTFGPEGSVLLLPMTLIAVLLIVGWKKWKGVEDWMSPTIISNACSRDHKLLE